MELCDKGHEQVCFESWKCPACDIKEALQDQIEEWREQVTKLNEEVNKLIEESLQ